MPPQKRDTNANTVVARQAIVITVGARPIKYAQITIRDRRTNDLVTIDNQNNILDEGDEGIPYAFKANERVPKNHPAVQASPDAFLPADAVDEVLQESA